MSSELERRLEGLLATAPEPDPGAGEEALHRALRALQPVAPPRRALRTAVLAFAAALVLLAIAAGSLAAAGALHVSFGAKKTQQPALAQLLLPKGANGIAAVVDGRLSVVTRGGFRLQGLRVTAAGLSPHALFVAAGIGHSLVALAPDGPRPWSHATAGRVVAITWAPYGNRIAYIVRVGRRLALHVIWGNGKNDTVIDRSVRSVRPSWRADSLAFAYVGAGGRAIVYDVGHARRAVIASDSPVTHVAFGPSGRLLAIATPTSVEVVPGGAGIGARASVGIGWLGRKVAVGYPTSDLGLLFPGQFIHLPGSVEAIDTRGRHVALALSSNNRVVLVVGTPNRLRTIEQLPRGTRVTDLELG
jgi:hypothetical protein